MRFNILLSVYALKECYAFFKGASRLTYLVYNEASECIMQGV